MSDTVSTTDEEDNDEKKEVAEIEPEIPKPTYNDEEVVKLVEYVQKMCTLQYFNQNDWKESALDVIRRWLMEVEEAMLVIYYVGNDLTASMAQPTFPVCDFCYFTRSPNQIFSVENFHDEVRPGYVLNDVDGSYIWLLNTVYRPMFHKYVDVPDHVKLRLFITLYRVLCAFTSAHYKLGGSTVLFLPLVEDKICRKGTTYNNKYVLSLESMVVFWIAQIRTLIEDREMVVPQTLNVLTDRYEFWRYRSECLQGIRLLLNHSDTQPIYKILRVTNSLYLKQLNDLSKICEKELDIARTNIKYLQLLVKPCNKIDTSDSPASVTTLLPQVIHMIYFIWLESGTLSQADLITVLFCDLSNQIIKFCIKKVNLGKILDGNTRFGIKMCNMAIDCCVSYKIIFDEIAKQHVVRNPSKNWNLKKDIIFNHIDTFIKRLCDLIDICEAMIVFGRLDETEIIPKPIFGGAFGSDCDKIIDDIETKFFAQLKSIRVNSKHLILNVYRNEWCGQYETYHKIFLDFEDALKRLLTNIFRRVCNIEERLEALNIMFYFSYRSNMQMVYLKQVATIWAKVQEEMTRVVEKLKQREKQYVSQQVNHVARVTYHHIFVDYLEWLCNRLEESYWLPILPAACTTLDKFADLKKEINKASKSIFEEWTKKAASVFQSSKLDHGIIVRDSAHMGAHMLECNMDQELLKAFTEAKHFEQLGLTLPLSLRKLYESHTNLDCAHNTVINICKDYNTALVTILPQERKLFQSLIQILDKKISSNLLKLTWADEINGELFIECSKNIEELQMCMELFKYVNQDIAENSQKMCDVMLFDLKSKPAVGLTKFLLNMHTEFKIAVDSITQLYNRIVELVGLINDEFECLFIENAISIWHNYVNQIDAMLETALLICGRNSLQYVLEVVQCTTNDVCLPPVPLLYVEVDICEQVIQLTPDVNSVTSIFNGMFERIATCLQQYPRLSVQMHIAEHLHQTSFSETFANDAESKKIQENIACEMDYSVEEITKYLKFWEQYRKVWDYSDNEGVEEVSISSSIASEYEQRIQHYSDLADEIALMDSVRNVHLFVIKQNRMRNSLMDCIEKRQLDIINMLLELIANKLEEFHFYMQYNGELISVVPRNLKEAQDAVLLFKKLIMEVSEKQNEFPQLLELLNVLNKYHIEVPRETINKFAQLDPNWQDYLNKLIEAEDILEVSDVDDLKQNLVDELQKFRTVIKKLLTEFLTKIPNGIQD
ncbi:dynein-1-beta heavy chain, flagellar inner arm I1 complex [Teleopsis dalmanni]|uniref:dynein-1-beta heavy chain, flagellar inner arm I1 complex n=1 Tax=Teleopsis dalmanni TaxID=139649 RepID=UPI0018CE57E9|nr:dynein-1-beta heavy chain, flagellar inner arm I1 complex [Teleopsis dalmanni]